MHVCAHALCMRNTDNRTPSFQVYVLPFLALCMLFAVMFVFRLSTYCLFLLLLFIIIIIIIITIVVVLTPSFRIKMCASVIYICPAMLSGL